jgi:predicted ABC-type exoprotein transport system permease subunit
MKQSKLLRIASIVSWLWGLLLLVIAASIAYPFIAQNKTTGGLFLYLSVMIIVGLGMCIAGYGIWKQKRPFNIVSALVALVCVVYFIVSPVRISLIAIVVGTFILGVVSAKWKEFA